MTTPRQAIRVGLGTKNQRQAEIFENFTNVTFPNWPEQYVTGDTFTGDETFLVPDANHRHQAVRTFASPASAMTYA